MVKRRTVCRVGGELVDAGQEGVGSSSEEMDCSPRSVLLPITKNRIYNHIAGSHSSSSSSSNRYGTTTTTTTSRNNVGDGFSLLHSQIRRIRDEDSHIGEDIHADVLLNLFGCSDDDNNNNNKHEVGVVMELSKRPAALPASPLSTGNNSTSAVRPGC